MLVLANKINNNKDMLQDDEELLNHQPLEEAHNAYKNHSP